MKFINTNISDVKIIEPEVFGDERGYFMETFRAEVFRHHCGNYDFIQDNHSKSKQGILRGLHYQTENTQGKLVRVVAGEVFDVAVDMRHSSATLGHYVGVYLSAENKRQLWVPPGFAHGFYVTSKSAQFVYKCTDEYSPDSEVSMKWDDPDLSIKWPIAEGSVPELSTKDKDAHCFANAPQIHGFL